MVRERGEDGTSVVDLLDASMVRNMKVSRGKSGNKNNRNYVEDSEFDPDMDTDGEDGPELGLKDGRFVIPDDDSDGDDSDGDDSDDNGGSNGRGGGGKKKRSRDDDDGIVDTGKDEQGFIHIAGRRARAREEGRAGGENRGVAAAASGKRQKTGTGAVRGTATGAEYRSKKAGGDVKRKGAKLEPYAYIPLDGRTLTGKKTGGEALKQYGAVVRAGGRGKKGYQQRRGGGQQKKHK